MSIEAALAQVLDRLSDDQIVALARGCADTDTDTPSPSLATVTAGAGPGAAADVCALIDAWSAEPGLTGAGVSLALRTGLAARQRADACRSQAVWTGPNTAGEQRLTPGVLHQLITGATERVLLMSFAAYTLPQIAADLEAAAARGCRVDVIFETEKDSGGQYSGPGAAPYAQVRGVTRWRWPRAERTPGAVLHAKLLIIDARRALIGSANLTGRALNDNLEAGVLINDERTAASLAEHVHHLMAAGCLITA